MIALDLPSPVDQRKHALMPTRAPSHRPHPNSKPRDYVRHAASVTLPKHWRRLRMLILADEPLCRLCSIDGRTTAATEVDHITPRHAGGIEDRSNLQPLCSPCHSTKTAREGLAARGNTRFVR